MATGLHPHDEQTCREHMDACDRKEAIRIALQYMVRYGRFTEPLSWYKLGRACLHDGRLDRFHYCRTEAAKCDPPDERIMGDFWRALAEWYSRRGSYVQAYAFLRLALRRHTHDPFGHALDLVALGTLSLKRKKFSHALKYLGLAEVTLLELARECYEWDPQALLDIQFSEVVLFARCGDHDDFEVAYDGLWGFWFDTIDGGSIKLYERNPFRLATAVVLNSSGRVLRPAVAALIIRLNYHH